MARRSLTPTLFKRKCPHGKAAWDTCPCIFHYKFTRGRNPRTGKPQTYSNTTGHATRPQAAEVAERKRTEVDAERFGLVPKSRLTADRRKRAVTIRAAVDAYLAEVEAGDRVKADEDTRAKIEQAIKGRRSRIETFIATLAEGGATRLHTISGFTLQRFQKRRARMRRQRGGTAIAEATINRETTDLRPLFHFCEREFECVNPFKERIEHGRIVNAKVRDIKIDQGEAPIPSDDQLRIALAQIGGLPDPWNLFAAITTAVLPRIAEVAMLRVRDVRPGLITRNLKGRKPRTVSVPVTLTDALLARDHGPAGEFIFPAQAELHRRRPGALSNQFIRQLRKIGIAGLSHHKFRHLGVTLKIEHGRATGRDATLNILALAGWTTLRQLPRYGHVRDEALADSVAGTFQRLDAILAATPAGKNTGAA
jgi:site-specific recombinase XerD